MTDGWKNKLYFGDNVNILRDHIADESIDLVYLDPPFNSNASYNILFRERSGEDSGAQITAFDDTWHWGHESERAYHEMVTYGPHAVRELLQAFLKFLGRNDMMAYIVMMAQRLVELHRVLRPTGSLYLHCDTTAGHYLRILLDAVFGPQNFRSEIIWKRQSAHSDAKSRFPDVIDVILFYAKSSDAKFNPLYGEHDPEYVAKFYRHDDDDGRGPYRLGDMASPNPRPNMMYEWMGFGWPAKGWRYQKSTMQRLHDEGRIYYPTKPDGSLDTSKRPALKRYLNEQKGSILTNVWTDIHPLHGSAAERLGYPTQKPEALLERIIEASSNEGDIVLDPFCGCGTTIAVAEGLNRRWIGIDITHIAITLMRRRLKDTFGDDVEPEVIGNPSDLGGAKALASEDPYQFEWWALDLVDAHPSNDKKKGADAGIDGYIYFFDDYSGQAKEMLVQVKSGNVNVGQVQQLRGAIEREDAPIGVFITLNPPSKPMQVEAASAGFYEPEHLPGKTYPRLQILTIEDLLDGKRVQYPALAPVATFKRADRRKKKQGNQKRFAL